MKVIKKEIELIEFKNLEGHKCEALKIERFDTVFGNIGVVYRTIKYELFFVNITQKTYKELTEHLENGKE